MDAPRIPAQERVSSLGPVRTGGPEALRRSSRPRSYLFMTSDPRYLVSFGKDGQDVRPFSTETTPGARRESLSRKVDAGAGRLPRSLGGRGNYSRPG